MKPFPINHYLLIFGLLITLTACQPIRAAPTPLPTTDPLPFETIAAGQAYTADNLLLWPDREPGLFVIASAADVGPVRQYLRPEIADTLAQLDFTDYFALLAFDGWKGGLYQDFQIQGVSRHGSEVVIVAQPNYVSGGAAAGVVTSLYHLTKVAKSDRWNETMRFKLYFDQSQTPVMSVEKYLP